MAILVPFCAGAISAASHNASLPSCHDANSREFARELFGTIASGGVPPAPSTGRCYKNSAWQADVALALFWLAAALLAAVGVAALYLAITGTQMIVFQKLLIAHISTLILAAIVTRI